MAPFSMLGKEELSNPGIYFISDTHLLDGSPNIADAFCHFLQHIRDSASALYLLGDLFEAWIGDDNHTAFNQRIIDELKRSSESHPCYFIPGNRDILMGKQFYQAAGLTVLKDPTVITLHRTRYLLSHGDRYCLSDKTHQRFRQLTQQRWLMTLIAKLPLSWRQHLATSLRKQSKEHQRGIRREFLDVTPSAIEKALIEHNCSAMIHGHTHAPAKHIVASHSHKNRWVLSDWEGAAAVILRVDEKGPSFFRWLI